MTPLEIERKFLIEMPDKSALKAHDARIKDMLQTYLIPAENETARVRMIREGDSVSYVKTVKRRISNLSHFEDEREISLSEYENELKNRDTSKKTIEKTRYCIDFAAHTLEIDVYPFWTDRAVLEIELSSEDESFDIPDYLKVIKEITDDGRYKNTNLAKEIPMDII